MHFIPLTDGTFISLGQVARIVPLRKADVAKLFDSEERILGEVSMRIMESLMGTLIGAAPNVFVTIVYVGENYEVVTERIPVLAWRVDYMGASPVFTETTEIDVKDGAILIELPDGRYTDPYTADYDSLEAAIKSIKENCTEIRATLAKKAKAS